MPEDELNDYLSKLKPEPAVTARQLMIFQVSSRQTVFEQVYWRTKELIQNLAKPLPYLVAIASEPHALLKDSPGKLVNVDFILPDSTVIFIGSVLDHRLAVDLWNHLLRLSSTHAKKHSSVQKAGPLAIRRESWFCAIPSVSDQLDLAIVASAVSRYLQKHLPSLTAVPLQWLNESSVSLAFALSRHFNQLAEKATPLESDIRKLSVKEATRLASADLEEIE